MEELLPKSHKDISLFTDIPSPPAEPVGFTADQLIRCEECLRANPPNRLACLYCGASLPANETGTANPKPLLRPLEKWEQGYNCILIKNTKELTQEALSEAADLLKLAAPDLQRIIDSQVSLPIARTAVSEEAKLIETNLKNLGMETIVVPDEVLALETETQQRLRTVELNANDLVVHPTAGDGVPFNWDQISLIVSGRLYSYQTQVKERKRRGVEKQIIDSHQTASDEEVLDVFTAGARSGWRILSNNFDFSCLGSEKKLMAGENFEFLKKLLTARAPSAEQNDVYTRLRRSLELIWPSDQHTSSLGWRRERAGKYSTSEAVITSNELQFTRYSRLCWFLKTQHGTPKP